MNIHDLRIGNVVKSTILRDGLYTKIASIPRQKSGLQIGLDVGDMAMGCLINELRPVLINKKVLLSCGFIPNLNYFYDEDDDPFMKYVHEEFNWFGLGEYNDKCWVINFLDQAGGTGDVKYLHELQNIFYSCTKTELKVNL